MVVRSRGTEIDRGFCRSETMQILAISGSLRSASTNTTLLNAAGTLAPKNMELLVYSGPGDLPHFKSRFGHTAGTAREACISVPLLGRNLDESGIIAEAEISSAVRSALARFADAIRRE